MTSAPKRVVLGDANVLINLIHVGRLDLCALIPGHEFVVPDHVREEVSEPAQRAMLDGAIERGVFRVEAIFDLATLAFYSEFTAYMGRGEAACLALALERGWSVASDERKRFRREAEARIGSHRLLGTADLFVLAIRGGLISVEQADADKALLEQRRFRMPFASFRELVK